MAHFQHEGSYWVGITPPVFALVDSALNVECDTWTGCWGGGEGGWSRAC